MLNFKLQKDIEELKSIISQSQRPNIKNFLKTQLSKLEEEYFKLINSKKQSTLPENNVKNQVPSSGYTKKIESYGWDESDKFCKIYITSLKDLNKVKEEDVKCNFTETTFDLRINNLNGVTYTLNISNLLKEIDPQASSVKVKSGMITVMLRKKSNETWSCLTQKEQKAKEASKPKLDENSDPQEGLMTLMKKMYEEGDDEMKKTIAKAWTESRDKQQNGNAGFDL